MYVHTKHKEGQTTVQEFDYIEIIDLIEELRAEPKTTIKAQILKRVANNPLWLKLLKYTYDTSITYGVKNLDEECYAHHHKYNAEILSIDYMFSLLDDLRDRKLTGDKAKAEILHFCKNCNDGLQEILQLVLWRDLNIGASIKSFNKAYGKDFLYVFGTMSARGKRMKYPCFGERKMNGIRCVVIKENGKVQFYSRNGKMLYIPYLQEQAEFLLGELEGVVLDCELEAEPSYFGEVNLYSSDALRSLVSGAVNSMSIKFNKVKIKENKENIKFNEDELHTALGIHIKVFDMLTLKEFRGKEVSPSQTDRYKRLDKLFDDIELNNIKRDKPVLIENPEQAKKFYMSIVSNKGEGAMFKLPDKPYQIGDSQYWIKSKQEVDVELEILGFYKGAKGSKREHTIGGVNLGSSCRKLLVNCGVGLKDRDIAYILENQDELIGRIINVRFNTIVESKGKRTSSVFLPRFYGGNKTMGNIEASLREDKDTANTLEEVKLAELDAQRFLFND